MRSQTLSKSRRHWLRVSVWGLVVLVLIIGAGLGWVGRSVRLRLDKVAAIQKAGGSVSYDWEWKNGRPNSDGEPWGRAWLTKQLGVDYFGNITLVTYGARGFFREAIQIGPDHPLDDRIPGGSPLTDLGIKHLEGVTYLESL